MLTVALRTRNLTLATVNCVVKAKERLYFPQTMQIDSCTVPILAVLADGFVPEPT